MCDGLARSYNWIALALGPHTLLRPIVLFALMALAYAAGYPINATTTMIALTLAIWSTALLQLVLVDRRLKGVVPAGPRQYEVRRWFATALPIIVVWSFYTMLCYADVLVLQQFRPPQEVGHYYAAVKTLMLVGFIHFSVSAAVAHRFTALHVAGDRAELAAFVAKSVRWTFWPSLAATLVMLALGKPMLWLFGPDFVAGYVFMLILSVGLLARAAVGPAERLLNMLGQQRICAAVYAAALAVNIALCVALIPDYGGTGAAFATSAAIVLESALLFVVARRRLGLHMFFLGRAKALIAAQALHHRADEGADLVGLLPQRRVLLDEVLGASDGIELRRGDRSPAPSPARCGRTARCGRRTIPACSARRRW